MQYVVKQGRGDVGSGTRSLDDQRSLHLSRSFRSILAARGLRACPSAGLDGWRSIGELPGKC